MSSRILGVFVVSLVLLGCGFQPMYAPAYSSSSADTAGNADIAAFFRNLDIAQINDRRGQILRGYLIRMLEQGSEGASRRYELNVTLSESTSDLAVKKSAFASRANLTERATFSVLDRTTRQVIFSSSAEMLSGYNIFSSEFQTLAAEKGARERALEQLAEEIRNSLGALYVQSISNKSGKAPS